MVKNGNSRVIATLTPKAQANLDYIIQETGLNKTNAIVLSLNNYSELLRKEKK